MKKLLISALLRWFTRSAARRLAGTLLDALLAALAGKASLRVVEAVRALVQALADDRREAAEATKRAAGDERIRARVAAIVDGPVAEIEALAARVRDLLPPEDPRPEPVAGERYRPAPAGAKTWADHKREVMAEAADDLDALSREAPETLEVPE